jgi:lysophospholipase L1-like esterase
MIGTYKNERRMRTSTCLLIALIVVAATSLNSQTASTWVGTWASSQQIPEPQNSLPDLTDLTLRETVHVSCGGSMIRVRLSNAFGARALHLTSVHIARPIANGSIDPASDHALLFNGSPDVTIPPAAEYLSDPIAYPLAALSDLTVSMHVEADPGQQTGHPGSRQTTFYAHGDLTASPDMPAASRVDHWYMLSGVDVQAAPGAYSIVALGDSITDGHGATTNGNDRWTDVLAQRLQAIAGRPGVLNQGTGVRYLIVLEGINDLGGLERSPGATQAAHDELVHRMIGAYQQIITRAHAHGIRVYGATVMPDGGSDYYHPDAASEQDRQKVNAWIREPGHFDGLIDFDKTTADPRNPQKLQPSDDSGDHLHPGPPGYRAMGEAITLSLFQ